MSLDWLSPSACVELEALINEIVGHRLAASEQSQRTESPLMTVEEAACYLRCKRQRIDDLLSSGRLRRIKEGRRTLLDRREIERYLHLETVRDEKKRR